MVLHTSSHCSSTVQSFNSYLPCFGQIFHAQRNKSDLGKIYTMYVTTAKMLIEIHEIQTHTRCM